MGVTLSIIRLLVLPYLTFEKDDKFAGRKKKKNAASLSLCFFFVFLGRRKDANPPARKEFHEQAR